MSVTLFFSRLLPCAMFRSPSFRRRNNKDPIWAMPDSTGYGHSSYGGGREKIALKILKALQVEATNSK